MKPMISMIMGTLCLSALLILCGCGESKVPGRPELLKVSGTVRFKQVPVGGATVVFAPQGNSTAAVSMTDANGHFQLQSFSPGDGAALGTYQVMISKVEVEDEKERHLLPQRYSLLDKSGLAADVKADQKNVFEFDLND